MMYYGIRNDSLDDASQSQTDGQTGEIMYYSQTDGQTGEIVYYSQTDGQTGEIMYCRVRQMDRQLR